MSAYNMTKCAESMCNYITMKNCFLKSPKKDIVENGQTIKRLLKKLFNLEIMENDDSAN